MRVFAIFVIATYFSPERSFLDKYNEPRKGGLHASHKCCLQCPNIIIRLQFHPYNLKWIHHWKYIVLSFIVKGICLKSSLTINFLVQSCVDLLVAL